jgi:prevent-host-death family protein
VSMNIVNVATLKEKLSYYLRLVKKGEEVIIISHRHPVGRILPAAAETLQIRQPRRPVSNLSLIKGIRLKRSPSAVKTLLEDRRRR